MGAKTSEEDGREKREKGKMVLMGAEKREIKGTRAAGSPQDRSGSRSR
jgi:hypothetical protein